MNAIIDLSYFGSKRMNLKNELSELQDIFAQIDLYARPSRHGLMELLIKKHYPIKLRIDGNQNHARPHIHIDYGEHYHAATYAIDNGERLVVTEIIKSNLDRKYDNAVRAWIEKNKSTLLSIWEKIRNGESSIEEVELLNKSTLG